MKILVNETPLDLFSGFNLEIEDTSPIFNDVGSQTLSFSLPATRRNQFLLGFPSRSDSVGNGAPRRVRCTLISGIYIRTGILNITGGTDKEISINIGFDNAIAYEAWKAKRLSELDSLPCLKYRNLYTLIDHMKELYLNSNPTEDDLAVFSISVGVESGKDIFDRENDYHEILSPIALWFVQGTGTLGVIRVIDGVETRVTVPDGYGCVPFVRVWKILECVFKDLGLKMDSNPFLEDIDLAKLVVLNNTADALCTGILDYSELMPDCTIEEFLNALFVRFGFVYKTDFDKGIVSVRLIRDIVNEPVQIDIDEYLNKPPESEYNTPKYVRLSAGTSLEGAAPLTDRLEDFLQGFSLNNVYCGEDFHKWPNKIPALDPTYLESTEKTEVEESDGPDFVEISRSEKPVSVGYQFSWDAVSGKWYRVSVLNGNRIKEESSSFFQWDPRPKGYDPWDLRSADECCPMGIAEDTASTENASDWVVMPLFFVGSRHFHTYVESLDQEDRGDCPLVFMFASSGMDDSDNGTKGRITAGSSLYFQFRGGLYDKFWKIFDLDLRNADRKVSASCRLNKTMLQQIDIFKPVRLQGVPMLIDTLNAVIGDDVFVEAQLSLIPMVSSNVDPLEIPKFPPAPDVLS